MPKPKRKNPTSQRFAALQKLVDKDKLYELTEAIALVKQTANTKFKKTPEGVDLAIKIGIDPRKENVRGLAQLPHGTGKSKIVAVLAKGDLAKEAEEAGADFVGGDDLISKIQAGFKDFDIIIATDEMAPQIGKIGKALGPKTPNKRNGTVTSNIAVAVKEIKGATRVEYRNDKGGVISVPIGRANFTEEQLLENFKVLLNAVVKAKPAGSKGRYLESVTLTSTMGPGIHLDPTGTQKAASS